MAVAGIIASCGMIALLFLEVVGVALVIVVLLELILWVIVICLPVFIAWHVIAGMYRRVMPVPLVVGRISHDGMASAVETVAHGLLQPQTHLPRRVLGGAVVVLLGWLLGYVLVWTQSPWTPVRTAGAIGLVVGVVATSYYTVRTIVDELGAGGSVERYLEDDLKIIDSTEDLLPDSADSDIDIDIDIDNDTRELQARVNRLASQANLPAPTVKVGRKRVPLAATIGLRPETSTIIVSTGLVDLLTDRELESVLAHELAHVSNRDAAMLTVLSLPVAKVRLIMAAVDEESSRQAPLHGGFAAVAPIVAGVCRWAVIVVARYREYVADRGAVAITGDPAALVSALEKLDAELEDQPLSDLRQRRSTIAFSIVPPPWEERRFFDRPRRYIARTIFGTHPRTERRIKRLRSDA